MSANRCFNAWYEASGRPNEYRSNAHCTVMSKTVCMAPTLSDRREQRRDQELPLDLVGRATDLTDDAILRNPYVIESDCREAPGHVDVLHGVTVTPGASVGTRTCVTPDPARPVTSRWDVWSADSTGRFTPRDDQVRAVGADVE